MGGCNSVTALFPCPAPTVLDGSVERAEVTDLYSWMEYQFRIIATNEYGSGEASIPSLKIKTWDSGENSFVRLICRIGLKNQTNKNISVFLAPVVSPTDIAGYGGKNGEIIITWTVSGTYM